MKILVICAIWTFNIMPPLLFNIFLELIVAIDLEEEEIGVQIGDV